MAETNITERFEFLTDIITSYDGKEQRIRLREHPRHFVSYNYDAMNSSEAQWLKAQLRMRSTDIYYIPMWHNISYLSEDFKTGKSLYIEKEYMYNFRHCDAIEIFFRDGVFSSPNIQKVVFGYGDGIIYLNKKLDITLDKRNAYIVPMYKCVTQASNNINYPFSNGLETVMNFREVISSSTVEIPNKYLSEYVYDIPKFNRYSLPTVVDNREVFLYEPQWIDNSLDMSIGKNMTEADNLSGVMRYDLKNTKSYDSYTLDILLENKNMINNIIKFFYRVSGRYKSFYAPSWVNDFNVSVDITANSNFIYINIDFIYKYYVNNARNKKIVVFTKDYKSYIYDVIGYSTGIINRKTYGKLILSKTADVNIPKEHVTMISFLNLVRFESDELRLDYESNVVALTSVTLKEVDDV